ncbi:MAG: Ig-like domain-containing protein, partial [Planctomycetota bacterium]
VSAATGASGWTLTNSGNATGVALTGSANADLITGGSGNDTLEGRAGSDTLTGGLGTDTLAYDNSSASVRIDLSRSAAEGGEAAGDTYSGIENVRGSANADALFGDQNNNQIDGGVGNDLILGGVNLVNDSHFTAVTPAGSYTIYSAGQSFGGWTVTAGTVDLVKSYWDPPPTGGQSVDTSGTTVGTIEQTLTTVAGNTYELFFYMTSGLTGANTRSLTLNVGGQTQDFTVTTTSAHTYSTMEWTAQYYTFTATSSSTTISFTGQTTNWGAAIGAVVVTNTTAAQGTDILDGGNGDDTLIAGGGNDTLTGGSGNDTLMGGAGNDTFTGGAGNDFFKVDAGTDSITDLGNGSDILTVSSGATANATVAGAWTATASSSNSGTAVLTASGFNINVSATSGSSGWTLTNSGNTTAVTLTGSLRPDTLVGGTGADTLFGGGGNDLISGGDGNDTLNGASGIDTISGGMGDDTLIGGGENDTLTGDAGNDTFTVDFGTDTITDLGNGVDILNVSATATANATVAGNWSATSSTSNFGTVTINGLGSNVNVSAATGTSGWTLNNAGATYQDSVLTGSANTDILIGGGFIDTLVGGAGNDSLTGGAGNDSFTGGTGNDTFTIDSGSDTITDFGSGADILNVSAGAILNATAASGWTATASSSNAGTATISANGFNLNVSAATGASGWTLTNAGNSVAVTLTGSANTDTLIGGSGDDSLNAGGGDDLLVGGDGNDSIYGAAGTDYAVYSTATAGVNVNLALTTAQDTGGAGIDTLLSIEGVDGSNFNDTLTGNASDNALWGRSGNDTLTGGGGNDSLLGGTGDDVAVFSGNWRDYTITTGSDANGTYYQLVDSTAARDGTDRIYDIESVQFADGTVSAGSLMNAPPIAAVDFATAVEAGGVSNGTAGTNPSGNVLTNDTDTNSLDTRTVTGVAAGSVGSASGNVGSSVNGTYGSISIAANGSYTYTVDNNNATVQALRTTGNTLTDTFTYTITDSWGLTSTTQVMVAIQGANDAPNDITGSLTVAEGSANGTAAGTVAGQDIDAGDSFSYSLIDTAGGRFAFKSSTGQVTVANGSLLDFQTAARHNLTVRVTDAMGATFDKVMTGAVTNSTDAPVLNTTFSPTLGSVLEGATNPSGITVASLVVDGSITDPDGSAVEAIAITGLNTSNGTWQYSLNGGTSWLTINAELINNQTNELALLLGPTAQLRLLPFGDLNGSLSNAITFRAWDQAIGSEGQYTVITSTGGSSPFSTASDSATITVMAVNDAPTFAPVAGTGKLLVPVGSGTDYAQSLTVQPDGRILVAGTSWNGTDYDFSLIRLNADGSLDTTFDTDGKLLVPVGYSDTTQSITVQPDGRIVVGGYSHDFNNVEFSLIRMTADGSLDTTFDTDGKLLVPVGYGNDYGYSVVVQPDGRILLAGLASNGNDYDFGLIRLNADGSLDTTFNGTATNTLGGSVSYTENGSPVVLDGNACIFDADLSATNFSGATLTLVRNGAANSQDLFSATGTLGTLTQGSSLTVAGTTIGTITTNSGGTLVLTFNSSATNALVNSAIQQIAFANSSDTPSTSVQIDWTFSDGNSGAQGTGGALTATGNIVVNITAVNDAPVATNDTFTTSEDTPVTFDVRTNDSDVDGPSLSVTQINGSAISIGGSVAVTGGSVKLNANGTLTFTPTDNYNGSPSFTYTVSDGGLTATATVNGTVTAINDAPTFVIGDGIVTTEIGEGDDEGWAVVMQSDGKIVLAGRAMIGSGFDFALVRYNANGSLDSSFGTGGRVITSFGGGFDAGLCAAIQPDGKILVAGVATVGSNTDVALVRYNTDGSLDTSFGTGGKVTTAINVGSSSTGYGITLQSDGKVIVAGSAGNGSNDDFALVRYNANGTLDTSFGGGDGIVTTAIGTTGEYARSVTLQPDGKIVLGGYSEIGGNFDFALVRYNPDGSLDSSFGTGGKVTTAIGTGMDIGQSVTLQPDGKIVVGGGSLMGSNLDFALVRYNADGSLDTTFGTGGKVTTALSASVDQGNSVTIQSDGKIVVGGTALIGSTEGFALVRYNADGSLDNSFGAGGKVTTTIGSGWAKGLSVTLQSDGRLVVGGIATSGGTRDFALVRYNADGSLDLTFDQAGATLGGAVSYTENGSPVVLDNNVRIFDAELSST